MKNEVAIISDVHNNLTNLKKILDFCKQKKIKTMICCGDLASLETLNYLNDNFSGEIHYTFGNMDDDYLRNHEFSDKYKNTFLYKDFGELEIGKNKIAFVHYPNVAQEICEIGKYDFVFHGHSHKPWEEEREKCKILNPGNVAGELFPPTFAVWNTDSNHFELIRINDLK